jgi:hypothetical protein
LAIEYRDNAFRHDYLRLASKVSTRKWEDSLAANFQG